MKTSLESSIIFKRANNTENKKSENHYTFLFYFFIMGITVVQVKVTILCATCHSSSNTYYEM